MAVGIAATTATYAVFSYLLFRSIPGISGEDNIVSVSFGAVGAPEGQRWAGYRSALPAMRAAAGMSGLERLAMVPTTLEAAVVASASADPSFQTAALVGAQYFSALGVTPRIGRLLTDDEAETRSGDVVVVSERFWRERLSGGRDAVGRTISVNGHPFVVVGVASRFRGWDQAIRVGNTDLWLPWAASATLQRGPAPAVGTLVGRIRDGASLDVIEQQLQAAYRAGASQFSASSNPLASLQSLVPFVARGLPVYSAQQTPGRRLFWLLMCTAVVLLVIGCLNAASLLVIKMARRASDTAVRLAVGASRWRIARQYLIESVLLSGLAGALGIVFTVLLTSSLRGVRLLSDRTDLRYVEIDNRVLIFALVITAATVLVVGFLPVVLTPRPDVLKLLRRQGRMQSGQARLRSALVASQVALSVLLVNGAAVLNRSVQNLVTTDLGLNVDNVTELILRPNLVGYDKVRSTQVISETVESLRRAGFHVATSMPDQLTGNTTLAKVKTAVMNVGERRTVTEYSVSMGFFEIVGLPILSGRGFSAADVRQPEGASPMPIVLSAMLANDLFGSHPAVGQTFSLERADSSATVAQVIGVAADTHSAHVRGEPQLTIYHVRAPSSTSTAVLVNSARPSDIERMRTIVHAVDPGLPITALRPLREKVTEALSEDRVVGRLTALAAVLAALLAAAGVIAVVGQLVHERARDLGIRLALGASRLDVLGNVACGAFAAAAGGVVLGLGSYWVLSTWLVGRLFGVGVLDLRSLAEASGGLLLVVLVAAYLPARLAINIEPAVALRLD